MEALQLSAMPITRSSLSLVALCAIVILLSLGGLAWAIIAGIALTLDGLLLVFTCLLMAGIFFLMLLILAKEHGWIRLPSKKAAAAPAKSVGAPAAAPPSGATSPPAGEGE